MEQAALDHRTESEYAFLNPQQEFVVRLRTKKNDVATIFLIYGDPFDRREDVHGVSQWHFQNIALHKDLQTKEHQYWTATLKKGPKRLQYAFLVTGLDRTQTFYGELGCVSWDQLQQQNMSNYFRLPYAHPIDQVSEIPWVTQTVWYQIFPERFANGDLNNDPQAKTPWDFNRRPTRQSYYGGDLQGIIDHLDDLQALGINGLYLTPIFKADSNHKYDTIDYFEIDPEFGDKRTFKKLVDTAHEKGMKVMLDAVFNHIGDQSVQWQDVLRYQENSKFKDWFHIQRFPVGYQPTDNFEVGQNLTYDTFAFNPHMPKFNTANPETAAYLLSVAKYWIQQFDIDGWRLDVADEVDHHFWRQFANLCRSLKPDFYILGEAWHNASPWLNGTEFSGVMNYQLTTLIQEKFLTKTLDNASFIAQLNQAMMAYRDQTNTLLFNLIGSHDTPRVLTIAQHNMAAVKAAFAFLFCQKGTPCIYYGDEIGMVGGPDPDNRRPMVWQSAHQNQKMYQFMKQLIHFRKSYSDCLTHAPILWKNAENHALLQWQRPGNGFQIEMYFNTSKTTQSVDLSGEGTILLQQQVTITDKIRIEPDGFVILRQNQSE